MLLWNSFIKIILSQSYDVEMMKSLCKNAIQYENDKEILDQQMINNVLVFDKYFTKDLKKNHDALHFLVKILDDDNDEKGCKIIGFNNNKYFEGVPFKNVQIYEYFYNQRRNKYLVEQENDYNTTYQQKLQDFDKETFTLDELMTESKQEFAKFIDDELIPEKDMHEMNQNEIKSWKRHGWFEGDYDKEMKFTFKHLYDHCMKNSTLFFDMNFYMEPHETGLIAVFTKDEDNKIIRISKWYFHMDRVMYVNDQLNEWINKKRFKFFDDLDWESKFGFHITEYTDGLTKNKFSVIYEHYNKIFAKQVEEQYFTEEELIQRRMV